MLRIVPAYYVSIVVIMLFYVGVGYLLHFLPAHLTANKPADTLIVPSVPEIWPHLLLIHNLFLNHASTINGSYWSLALEFQLYFFFPLLLELAVRWGVWRTLAVTLLIQLTYSSLLHLRPELSYVPGYEFVLQKAVFARLFEFSSGMAAAYVVANANPKYRWMKGPFGTGISLTVLLIGFALATLKVPVLPLIDVLWALGFSLFSLRGVCPGSTPPPHPQLPASGQHRCNVIQHLPDARTACKIDGLSSAAVSQTGPCVHRGPGEFAGNHSDRDGLL